MTSKKKSPTADLVKLVEYMERDEGKHIVEMDMNGEDTSNHIYHSVRAVKDWLTANGIPTMQSEYPREQDWEEILAREADAERWSTKGLKALRRALNESLAAGFSYSPTADDQTVRAADLLLVRRVFYEKYDSDVSPRVKQMAFARAVEAAQEAKLVSVAATDDRSLVWLRADGGIS
jgi:hypothetical protein